MSIKVWYKVGATKVFAEGHTFDKDHDGGLIIWDSENQEIAQVSPGSWESVVDMDLTEIDNRGTSQQASVPSWPAGAIPPVPGTIRTVQ